MKISKSFLRIYLLSAFVLSIMTGCGEDKTSVITPPPVGGPFTLSGSVSNYPGGSVIAKAKITKSFPVDSFFVGIDTIDNSGLLNMPLSTPPTDFLVPIIVPPGITVSDTSARIVGFSELRAYNFSNVLIARIPKKNFADTNVVEGSFIIQYLFSTKAVSITGSDTSISFFDTTIANYNINLQADWNALTIKLVTQRPNYELVDYRNGEASGATWRYETPPDFRKFYRFLAE